MLPFLASFWGMESTTTTNPHKNQDNILLFRSIIFSTTKNWQSAPNSLTFYSIVGSFKRVWAGSHFNFRFLSHSFIPPRSASLYWWQKPFQHPAPSIYSLKRRVQTFWLVLQAVLHEVVHHNSHQEHLRLGEANPGQQETRRSSSILTLLFRLWMLDAGMAFASNTKRQTLVEWMSVTKIWR